MLATENHRWWLDGNHESGNRLDWIIAGGETGPKARPLHPDWVRSLGDQCQAAGVPLFIKTFPVNGKLSNQIVQWPEDVRIRRYPDAIANSKIKGGKSYDGRDPAAIKFSGGDLQDTFGL